MIDKNHEFAPGDLLTRRVEKPIDSYTTYMLILNTENERCRYCCLYCYDSGVIARLDSTLGVISRELMTFITSAD